jgi:F-type H+-transporting ATPase subunit delta
MSVSLVNNYSKALVELAAEHNTLSETAEAAKTLLEVFEIREFLIALSHPKFPVAEKKALIARVLPAETPAIFSNFFKLIIDRRRERYLPLILEKTLDLILEAQGREIIEIISARKLSETELDAITSRLSKLWQVSLYAKYRENSNLQAGIVIRRGDQLFDGSLRGRLASMRGFLMTESKTIGKEGR